MNRALHITVGIANTAPSLAPGIVDLSTEMQLVKAAILYGDTATLCSTSCVILKAAESIMDKGLSSKPLNQFALLTPIVETYMLHKKEEIEFGKIEQAACHSRINRLPRWRWH